MELRNPEAQRDHDVAPGGGDNLLECMTPSTLARIAAGDDAQQHRDIGDEARTPFDQAENDQEHEQRDAKSLQLAIARVGKRTGNAVDDLGQVRQAAAGPVDCRPASARCRSPG